MISIKYLFWSAYCNYISITQCQDSPEYISAGALEPLGRCKDFAQENLNIGNWSSLSILAHMLLCEKKNRKSPRLNSNLLNHLVNIYKNVFKKNKAKGWQKLLLFTFDRDENGVTLHLKRIKAIYEENNIRSLKIWSAGLWFYFPH